MSPRRISQAFLVLMAATAFSVLLAEDAPKPADTKRPARAAGKKAAKAPLPKVRTLYGLDWHGSLASAQQASAPQAGKAGKPVFWLRMLGDLNGFS